MYARSDRTARLLVSLALIVLATTSFVGCRSAALTPAPEASEEDLTEAFVSAIGKVVPITWAELAFATPGRVAEILVAEGDRVEAGQVIARLDASDMEAAVAQADAAVEMARAQLAQLEAGPRDLDVASAQAAVATAQDAANAAAVAVEVAQATAASASAAGSVAQASLQRLRAGPTADELEVARQQVEQAKALRYAAQGQRATRSAASGSTLPAPTRWAATSRPRDRFSRPSRPSPSRS